jgi:DNA polymerase-1
VSGDRDLFQVVSEAVDMLFVGRRGQKPVLYDQTAVERRFGVRVDQLPSLMALTGDRSDNLPGLPGIGARTAATLVSRFGSMSQLLERVHEVRSEPLRETLSRAREQLLRNETLSRLRVDVPLPLGPRFLPVVPAAWMRLRELFAELEFKSLLPRLDRLSVAVEV